MSKRPPRKSEPETPQPSLAPPPPPEKVCKVVLEGEPPPYRIIIRCPGAPDVVLLELGDVMPGVPILQAEGASNIRVR
jgi:hypothetical protein